MRVVLSLVQPWVPIFQLLGTPCRPTAYHVTFRLEDINIDTPVLRPHSLSDLRLGSQISICKDAGPRCHVVDLLASTSNFRLRLPSRRPPVFIVQFEWAVATDFLKSLNYLTSLPPTRWNSTKHLATCTCLTSLTKCHNNESIMALANAETSKLSPTRRHYLQCGSLLSIARFDHNDYGSNNTRSISLQGTARRPNC